jgi:hypothetical protein
MTRIVREIEALAIDRLRDRLDDARALGMRVLAGELDTHEAAQLLIGE